MIPTVILHEDYQDYLDVSVQVTSKNNKVFLIGNPSVKLLEKYHNVEFVDISKFTNKEKFKNYRKHFVNYSNYDEHASWFWFVRVIILYEFMKEFGFTKIFSCDSDNILLKDISKYKFNKDSAICIPKVWEPFTFTSSVHAGLISNNFCEEYEKMFVDVYVNKSRLDLFEDKINFHKTNPGSFCDMTFYHFLISLNLIEADNLLEPVTIDNNRYVFINNYANGEGLNSREQYKVNRKGIKIYNNKKLFTNTIYDQINNEYINIFNLHFQGKHKKYLNKSLLRKLNF